MSLCLFVSERGKGRRQAILGEHPSSYTDNGYGKIKTKGTQVCCFNQCCYFICCSQQWNQTRFHQHTRERPSGGLLLQRMPWKEPRININKIVFTSKSHLYIWLCFWFLSNVLHLLTHQIEWIYHFKKGLF